jgi:hypothetical protein
MGRRRVRKGEQKEMFKEARENVGECCNTKTRERKFLIRKKFGK